MTRKIEWYEKRANPDGSVDVIGWAEYERWSVLAGQMGKIYVATFASEAEAEAEYGEMGWNSKWTEPQVSLNHLPGEGDYVPGGEYPDDW
jgi:hypothetical protein